VPDEADYVAQSWQEVSRYRYDAVVLIGPDAGLAPDGPSGARTDPRMYQLWLGWAIGDETVRRHVANLAVYR
jgi:hypothetical protein